MVKRIKVLFQTPKRKFSSFFEKKFDCLLKILSDILKFSILNFLAFFSFSFSFALNIFKKFYSIIQMVIQNGQMNCEYN